MSLKPKATKPATDDAKTTTFKFYDASGAEVAAGNHSTATFYVWCVNRALAYSKDQTCTASFMSDMNKNPDTRQIIRDSTSTMMLLMLQGTDLRKFIAGYTVPGIAKVECT